MYTVYIHDFQVLSKNDEKLTMEMEEWLLFSDEHEGNTTYRVCGVQSCQQPHSLTAIKERGHSPFCRCFHLGSLEAVFPQFFFQLFWPTWADQEPLQGIERFSQMCVVKVRQRPFLGGSTTEEYSIVFTPD